jgi:ubiquinone/menaquinone biosynthesis C-methylase UbiE
MKDVANKQEEVRQFWDSKPCDSELSGKDPRSKDYFLEIENERYKYQSHIPKLLSKIDLKGKRILEIGTGVGTDARKIVEYGGIYTGINVDAGSVDMTAKALSVFSVPGEVRQCSATVISFKNESFDVVYSFGVLHHIPEVEKAVAEIRRVLKPGGELLVMVYNKSSINYYIEILFLRKLFLLLLVLPGVIRVLHFLGLPREKLERHVEIYRTSKNMNAQEWLSRNTDGPDNPYSCVYGRIDAEKLFHDFSIISDDVYFFDYRHWGIFGRAMPQSLVNYLGKRWGWHRIVHAMKRS